ncbi:hypothetical protein EJ04DRAFT_53922 [Polyplosphaeria fusca]|uniref:Uncharacterized protein n=1 Tax=Polyplosphaeria fusca TaxID=682080 RepID=A0A9P4UVL2_9PLEO|nr:hypothetical protein EJ04DRAFT_53922 [Polyplosphaeria fusca]
MRQDSPWHELHISELVQLCFPACQAWRHIHDHASRHLMLHLSHCISRLGRMQLGMWDRVAGSGHMSRSG